MDCLEINKMVKFSLSTLFVEYLPFLVSLIYIVVCPYNKVEESFNMQACHDILYHGFDLEKYDHNDFPGTIKEIFFSFLFKFSNIAKFIFRCCTKDIFRLFVCLIFCLSNGLACQLFTRAENHLSVYR